MLINWCSTGGAPGVSSWSVLTAGLWPADAGREVVVVEADPSAGVMATRYGIGVTPGAAELVVQAREPGPMSLGGIGRKVGEAAWLIPGPVVPSEATAVWNSTNAAAVADLAERDSRTWFVDVGRFGPTTWLWHERAALTLALVPGYTDALVSAQTVVSELAAVGRTKVLVVGQPDYEPTELGAFFGCPLDMLPTSQVVSESTSVWGGTGWWRRGANWDRAARLAAELAELGALIGGE